MTRPRTRARIYVLHYTYRAHRHKLPAMWTPNNNKGAQPKTPQS